MRFWSGDPMPMPDLRRQLKAIGEDRTCTFSAVKIRDLARQRLRFLPRLLHAAGHTGWVVLFDEVELIGRHSLLQRGRSCAVLARWLVGDPGNDGEPLLAVAAMTDDSRPRSCPVRITVRPCPAGCGTSRRRSMPWLATLAELGMQHVEQDRPPLVPPDESELDRAYRTQRELHAGAYDWEPPDVAGLEGSVRRGWVSTSAPGSTKGISCARPALSAHTDVVDVPGDYRELAGQDDDTS